MSCQWNGGEVLWGLEAEESEALQITVTVSVLSMEDSPICPHLASVLFSFQVHEVKRVTGLSPAGQAPRHVILQPVRHCGEGVQRQGSGRGP